MEQSPFWEANTSATSQGIPWILCKSKRHYSGHNSMPLSATLSQINACHILPTTSLRHILISSSHLRLGLHPSFFPTKTVCVFFFSPLRATCFAYLIMPNLWHTHSYIKTTVLTAWTLQLTVWWGTCLKELVCTGSTAHRNLVRKENARETALLAVFNLH
jgi:hypothetical protein